MKAVLIWLLFSLAAASAAVGVSHEKGGPITAAFFALRKEGLICMNKSDESLINPVAMQATASVIGTERRPLSGPVVGEEFQFQNQRVRIAYQGDAPLFVAKDLAPVLGYRNARSAVRNHVAPCDRYGVLWEDPMGRSQILTAVNESGVFALIIGSAKPEARKFKAWLTGEVLPSIRKTGRYEVDTTSAPLWAEINRALRGRGAARSRQVSRIVAHRNGLFDIKIGNYWVRNLSALNVAGLPLSHALREGRAISAVREGPVKSLVQ
jgi:prophage antirepressor-like protein